MILAIISILVLIWTGLLGYDLLFGPMVESAMPDFAFFAWLMLSVLVTSLTLRTLVVKWRHQNLKDGWLWIACLCAVPNGVLAGIVITFLVREFMKQ